MLKKFAKQFVQKRALKGYSVVSSPFEDKQNPDKLLFSGLTKHAIKLYEKKSDIKKFTKLALSDPENLSHNDRMKELFEKETDDLFDLTNNERFLKDLGL